MTYWQKTIKVSNGWRGYSPLEVAVMNDRIEMVKYMLNNCEMKGHFNENPGLISWAAFRDDIEMIKVLEQAGFPYYVKVDQLSHTVTPMHIAAACGYDDVINYFLTKEYDINTGLPKGTTDKTVRISLLSAAAAYNQNKMCDYLLNKGASLKSIFDKKSGKSFESDMNQISSDGTLIDGVTPLHMAVGIRSQQLVKLFLDKGSDVNGGIDDVKLTPYGMLFNKQQKIDFKVNFYPYGTLCNFASICCSQYIDVQNYDKEIFSNPKLVTLPDFPADSKPVADILIAHGAIYDFDTTKPESLFNAISNNNINLVKKCLANGIPVNSYNSKGDTALSVAAMNGSIEVMKYLLEKGAYVEGQGMANPVTRRLSCTPLQNAARYNAVNAMELLLANGANINLYDTSFRTPLFYAVNSNSEKAAEYLLSKNAKIEIYGYNEDDMFRAIVSPLHIAIENNLAKLAISMINKINDVNMYDSEGRSLLYFAIQQGNMEIINLLLARGAQVKNTTRGVNQPLHVANTLEIVKLLVEKKADPNMRNAKGNTLLHKIVMDVKKNDILQYLLDNGANPDIQDVKGLTPAMIAVNFNNINALKILIGKGADMSLMSATGDTALSIALKTNANNDILNLIYEQSKNKEQILNRQYDDKKQLIFIIIDRKDVELLQKVCKLKINLNNIGPSGTLIHYILTKKLNKDEDKQIQLQMLQILVDTKADLNIRYMGLPPVFSASSPEVVKILIKGGADMTLRDQNGNGPLNYAVANNNINLAAALLENGISPGVKNSNGISAVAMINRNNTEMAELFAKYIKKGAL
jgi:ankyrin repeat protein